jgi:hypothetical protein
MEIIIYKKTYIIISYISHAQKKKGSMMFHHQRPVGLIFRINKGGCTSHHFIYRLRLFP